MAQRATAIAKKPGTAKSNRVGVTKRGVADDATLRAIPVNLAPLLQPYKKHGRLSVRIENLQRLARLSAGRNNGDGSWSLAPDELEDLSYLVPEGIKEAHKLAIRVVSVSGGSILGVLEFPITPGDVEIDSDSADAGEEPAADSSDNGVQLQLLRDELAKLKDALSARDSELSALRQESDRYKSENASSRIESELAAARAAWAAEMNERLAGSQQDSQKQLADARERWQREVQDTLAKAEQAWKTDTAAQIAAVEAQWRDKSAKSVADIRAEAQAARERGDTAEFERMRDEFAALTRKLAERESALQQAHADAEKAREQWQRETREALAKAETAWKADTAAQLASVEVKWQTTAAKLLAEAQSESDISHGHRETTELSSLHDQIAVLTVKLSERDKALSNALVESGKAREQWKRDLGDRLAMAEQTWKSDTAAKLAAAETQWRQKSEKALAEARAEAQAARELGEAGELRRAYDEMAALRAALNERDALLANAGTEAEKAKTQIREIQASLSKTENAWKAEIAAAHASLSERETELAQSHVNAERAREQAAIALRDAAAAANAQWREKSDAALAVIRAEMEAARSEGENERHRLQDELAASRAAVAEQEAQLVRLRSEIDEARREERREAESALTRDRAAWNTDMTAQLAATEAQWQRKFAKAASDARADAEALRRTLQQEAQDALTKAEQAWKDDTAAQLSAVELKWQAKSSSLLAETRAQADIALNRGGEELRRLREDAEAMRSALAARESDLLRLATEAEDARRTLQRESAEALARAEQSWTSETAAKLAAAEAQWQAASGKQLAAARAEAEALRGETGEELRRLRGEFETVQSALTERESELAQLRAEHVEARKTWLRESNAAMAKERAALKADTAAKLAAADAQWRKKSASDLADAKNRYELAERALAQVRAKSGRGENDVEAARLRDEVLRLQATLADRETELAHARSGEGTDRNADSSEPFIMIQTNRDRSGGNAKRKKSTSLPSRDVFVALALGAAAILLSPGIERFMPQPWQSKIAAVTDGVRTALGKPRGMAASFSSGLYDADERIAIVARDANMRANPSTSADIVTTLKHGTEISVVEQRGNWSQVRVAAKPQPRLGWVYSSFLKNPDGDAPTGK